MIKTLTVVGTRPEAIKMAPIVTVLSACPTFESKICVTAQHRSLVDEVLDLWRIVPDYDLDVMRHAQALSDVTIAVLDGIGRILEQDPPDVVLVQGDTTTAMAAALAAFYQLIPVAHVEAGLRTWDSANPFPEEVNRRVIGAIAALHFAPTQTAAANLLREGVAGNTVHITGNTIVDATLEITRMLCGQPDPVVEGVPIGEKRIVLVTAHRRENQLKGMEDICRAVLRLRHLHNDVHFVVPTHPNPVVSELFHRLLGGHNGITVTPALSYPQLLWTLRHSHLVLTDSGGLQEEASLFERPVLVLRQTTERIEGIHSGLARLVGTDPGTVVAAASELLANRGEYHAGCRAPNLYGDGRAARRIVELLRQRFLGGRPSEPEFRGQLHIPKFEPVVPQLDSQEPDPRTQFFDMSEVWPRQNVRR
ncbi:non-hydrolyzing UDP-N-acetylglucosamine 2-epimerase [Mycobacterium sp. NPDC048908]|uniref:non-hydrolyzing UDP-N-acetylglucosamine 2-epimerase n=1 Tax=Mycobacterium sp. NPDC048908 TaxID=3364292 RepID=UPI0037216222